MRRSGVLAIAFLLVVSARPARAGEVVEPFDDGTPHRRFTVDDQGRKDGRFLEYFAGGKTAVDALYRHDVLEGAYAEFYESGKPKVRTSYRAGKRHGKFEAFGEDGEPVEASTYVDGAFDGKRQVWRAHRLAATQTWKAGTLSSLDGTPAFATSREEVEATFARILAGELPAAPPSSAGAKGKAAHGKSAPSSASEPAPGLLDAPEELRVDRENALRLWRGYRYLCGIPWQDCEAAEAPTRSAQYAALVCARLGKLSHDPPNPGLPDDVYAKAHAGASDCNLAGRCSAFTAVDGWMDDSDSSNLDRLGHRRWALSLVLRYVGFGDETGPNGFRVAAMHVKDSSRSEPKDVPVVCFPPRGWMPANRFSDHHAWSVFPDASTAARWKGSLGVEVRPLSEDAVPAEESLAIEDLHFDDKAIAERAALIFRPKGVAVTDGARYLVEVRTLDPKSKKGAVVLRWIAGFYGSSERAAPAEGAGGDASGG